MSDAVKQIADLSPQRRELLARKLKEKRTAATGDRIKPRARDAASFPLSSAQQRLWFLDKLQPDSAVYNNLAQLDFETGLNIAALKATLNAVVRRHEILRTRFPAEDGRPSQVISEQAVMELDRIDLAELHLRAREGALQNAIRRCVELPFDLERGPVFRAALIHLGTDRHLLLLTMHHIVCDGWSIGILIREIRLIYEAFCEGREVPLAELEIQYADYAVWQKQQMESGELAGQIDYWKRRLQGAASVLELPTDYPRPAAKSYSGEALTVVYDSRLREELEGAGRRHNATLYMMLLTGYKTLLMRYSGQQNILVGTPVAGRTRGEVEGLIGFFVNTLVMRSEVRGEMRVKELIEEVRESVIAGQENQEVPFEKVVEEVGAERSLSHDPLFQVMFTLQNLPGQDVEMSVRDDSILRSEQGTARFDLTLVMGKARQGELYATIEYSTDLYEAERIRRMAGHLRQVLEAMAAEPERKLSELTLMSEREREQLIREWNQTRADYPWQRLAQELFEQQARERGERVAIEAGGQQMSYEELNRKANQVGRYLRGMGVGAEVVVGVCAERGIEMVIGLMGVMKAGAAYLPLDPDYPASRLRFMLEDCGVGVVLGQEQVARKLPEHGLATIWLDSDWDIISLERDDDFAVEASPENLAYVIYTSGSTGQPKGVMITHQGLVNYLSWCGKAYEADSGRSLVHTSIAFDLTVTSLFSPLVTGQTAVLLDDGIEDLKRAIIEDQYYSLIKLTPSHLDILSEMIEEDNHLARIGAMVIGGEILSGRTLSKWRARAKETKLINEYGPTETVVGCCAYQVDTATDFQCAVPIGSPIANTQIYILDDRMQPVPVGVPGELYVGGDGVARGYRNRPDLTAESFLPDLFATEPGSRLYKTGDRARYLFNGQLEMLGRVDDQVKLRGYRIELAEVDLALSKHPDLREAVTVMREDDPGEKKLVAYITLKQDRAVTSGQLRAFLKDRLPEYMIPAAFVTLKKLQLSPNGKVDRKALPAPGEARMPVESSFVAPRNKIERSLAAIWMEVLRADVVGVKDNFFELGGDSILGIQIIAKANQLGFQLTTRNIFQYQTIAELATLIEGRQDALEKAASHNPTVPLTPMQEWLLEGASDSVLSFAQTLQLDLAPQTDLVALRGSVLQLFKHHEALAIRFVRSDEGWQQIAGSDERGEMIQIDLSELSDRELEDERIRATGAISRSTDLSLGISARLALINSRPEQPLKLLIAINSLVADRRSWTILLNDLELAYRRLAAGEMAFELEPARGFLSWAGDFKTDQPNLFQEADYWASESRRNADIHPPRGIEPEKDTLPSKRITLSFSMAQTQRLIDGALSAYRMSLQEVLHIAFAQTITRWAGTSSLLGDTLTDCRRPDDSSANLSRTVGCLTTTYPAYFDFAGCASLQEELKSGKEQLRNVPRGGIGYGLLKGAEDEEVRRRMLSIPRASVYFEHITEQHQSKASFDVEGVTAPQLFARRELTIEESESAFAGRDYLLGLMSSMVEGHLELTWNYDNRVLNSEDASSLARQFVGQLETIIAHCESVEGCNFTPTDFPLAKLTQEQIDRLIGSDRNIEDAYTLSPMQEGMLYHTASGSRLQPYFRQTSLPILSNLNIDAFKQAWQRLIDRHPVLRTAFFWKETDRTIQVVYKNVPVPMTQHDWRHINEQEQEARLKSFLAASRSQGVDLSKAPPMRLSIIRLSDETYQFTWSDHHILFDGWSQELLLKELNLYYLAFAQGEELELERGRPYRDYIKWLNQQDLNKAEIYWRKTLKGFVRPTTLPTLKSFGDSPRAQRATGLPGFSMSAEQTASLELYAKENRITVNTLLQAAWAILLSRYTGDEDVLFGATGSGRPAGLNGVERMIGVFINTLPVRARIDENTPVLDWIKRLQDEQSEAREYEYASLADVQQWSDVAKGAGLFENILVFQNLPENRVSQQVHARAGEGEKARKNEYSFTGGNYSITVIVSPSPKLTIEIGYDPLRYDADSIGRVAKHLRALLDAIIANPVRRLSELELLNESERHQTLIEWNDTKASSISYRSFQEFFESQAKSSPEFLAVRQGAERLDYKTLNGRANRLARHLISVGIGPESLVAILVKRGADFITCMLAILKAGAAYAPVDPTFPDQWNAEYLKRLGGDSLISDREVTGLAESYDGRVIRLDLDSSAIARRSSRNLKADRQRQPEGAHLACVIASSGHGGRPEHLMIEQRALLSTLRWAQQEIGIEGLGNVLASTPVCMSGSIIEILGPLSCGGTVTFAESTLRASEDCQPEEAAMITGTPSSLQRFLNAGSIPSAVNTVLVRGEPLHASFAQNLHLREGVKRVFNVYGVAEATGLVAVAAVEKNKSHMPGIGRPAPNTRVYILDSKLRPVTVGVVGEMHIAGAGLARGYLNDPALTAGRFLPDPLSGEPGARLYKTGDLARYRADGEIEFLSRKDEIVNLDGNRVSLSAVKAALDLHPRINEAAVIVTEDKGEGRKLRAYLAADVAPPMTAAELRRYLKVIVGEKMLPSEFVTVDRLPRTPTGALDRQRLPAPTTAEARPVKQFIGPRDLIEYQLAELWEEILVTKPISVNDNFFELGGSSLLVLRFVAELQQRTGKTLPLDALIKKPTIEFIAEVLRGQSAGDNWSPLVPIQPQGSNPPLFCFHAVDGYVNAYLKLAGRLGTAQPCYGLQAAGLEEGMEPLKRVEEMAALYLEAIKSAQAEGPYLLCGASSGGVIAFEVAQQLLARGERVGLLAMFDTGRYEVDKLAPFEVVRQRQVARFIKQYAAQLGLSDELLEQARPEDRLALIVEQGRSAGLFPPGTDERRVRRMITFNITSMWGLYNYKVQPYDGEIIFFRAEEALKNDGKPLDLGWASVPKQGLKIEVTPGEHTNQILEPHAAVVAEKLKRHIENSLGSSLATGN